MKKTKTLRKNPGIVSLFAEQQDSYSAHQPLSFEIVWKMFQETDKKFLETDKKFKEIAKMFKETDKKFKETDKKWQETDKKWIETDKRILESKGESERKRLENEQFQKQFFKKIDDILDKNARDTEEMKIRLEAGYKEDREFFRKTIKESRKKSAELENLFTGQWGRLMESLIEGDLLKLLNKRGIEVARVHTRMSFSHKQRDGEIDLMAVNGSEVVIVEIKTTLHPNDVKHFLETLSFFKEVFKEYSDKVVYGAVAYLRTESKSAQFAEKCGLFTIRATGNSASIVNQEGFKPKAF